MEIKAFYRKIITYIVMGIFFSALAFPTYAWNIVCGVSIGFTDPCAQGEALLTQQFIVDSQLLKGSGDYYLAISELQLVNINNVRNGHPSQEDRAAISQGQSYLTSSLNTVQDAVAKGTNLLAATANTPCNFLAGERRTANDTLNRAKRLTDILASLLESFSQILFQV